MSDVSCTPMNIVLCDEQSAVIILDQTLLPNETVYLTLDKKEDLWEAIHSLRVRGAPAIGIFAAFSLYILAKKNTSPDFDSFYKDLTGQAEYLNSSRPTAVNLSLMLKRMLNAAYRNRTCTREVLLERLKEEALSIQEEDIAMNRKVAEYGLSLLHDGDNVITHCNAGPLATSKYGTAQGALILSKERGVNIHVWVEETRPLLQGARLTSFELTKAGIPCTLICDNMSSNLMRQGKVQAVFYGADRIAMNGDTANKIGSSNLAIIANYYQIPVYVCAASNAIDPNCPSGDSIPIELRDPDEIKTKYYTQTMALPEVSCYNPSFDITDHSLISAIVTEKGIVYPPFSENFVHLLAE